MMTIRLSAVARMPVGTRFRLQSFPAGCFYEIVEPVDMVEPRPGFYAIPAKFYVGNRYFDRDWVRATRADFVDLISKSRQQSQAPT